MSFSLDNHLCQVYFDTGELCQDARCRYMHSYEANGPNKNKIKPDAIKFYKQDLKSVMAWPLSCYGPVGEDGNFISGDFSPEEFRFVAYSSSKDVAEKKFNEQVRLHQLKLKRLGELMSTLDEQGNYVRKLKPSQQQTTTPSSQQSSAFSAPTSAFAKSVLGNSIPGSVFKAAATGSGGAKIGQAFGTSAFQSPSQSAGFGSNPGFSSPFKAATFSNSLNSGMSTSVIGASSGGGAAAAGGGGGFSSFANINASLGTAGGGSTSPFATTLVPTQSAFGGGSAGGGSAFGAVANSTSAFGTSAFGTSAFGASNFSASKFGADTTKSAFGSEPKGSVAFTVEAAGGEAKKTPSAGFSFKAEVAKQKAGAAGGVKSAKKSALPERELEEWEMVAFKLEQFELGKIPELEPPSELR